MEQISSFKIINKFVIRIFSFREKRWLIPGKYFMPNEEIRILNGRSYQIDLK